MFFREITYPPPVQGHKATADHDQGFGSLVFGVLECAIKIAVLAYLERLKPHPECSRCTLGLAKLRIGVIRIP